MANSIVAVMPAVNIILLVIRHEIMHYALCTNE
jgi:hypothetical protein